tara:strand:+ start:114 stop:308 length:195 start_codon:yes stop_codon:yes gene_type:complete
MIPSRVINYFDIGHVSVYLTQVGAITLSFFEGIELGLRISSLAVAIGYGVWKWYSDFRKQTNKS